MKVVLSHDWLVGMRGGEKCLEAICRIFPDSEIFTLFHAKKSVTPFLESKRIHASILQSFPFAPKVYKHYLPLYPAAVRAFQTPECRLMISVSHCAAKGLRKPSPDTVHICYCLTPMRYAWLFFEEYFSHYPVPLRWIIQWVLGRLRRWDQGTNRGVTHFIAISECVKKRIKSFYGREASVIYPPVDTDFYTPSSDTRGDFYLTVSALVPYKRIDFLVDAFTASGEKLLVIGDGPLRTRLEKRAGPSIQFLGAQRDTEIRRYYRTCKAFVFPSLEDFGIAPLEAQACGAPVIAFAGGGAIETVIQGETGLFFKEQNAASLERALARFSKITWDPRRIRQHAERFSTRRFEREFQQAVYERLEGQPTRQDERPSKGSLLSTLTPEGIAE